MYINSPVSGFPKPPNKFVLILQLDDDLFTEVEDRTISAGAENLLV